MSISESITKPTTAGVTDKPKGDTGDAPRGGDESTVAVVAQPKVEQDDGAREVEALDDEAPDYIAKLARLASSGNKAAKKAFAELSGQAETRKAGALGDMDDLIGGEKDSEDSGLDDDHEVKIGTDGEGNFKVESDEHLGPLGSVALGKGGVGVGGVELAEGVKAGLHFGPNDQKVELEIDKSFTVPPPEGLELDLFKVAIPLAPGVGFDFAITFESSLEFGSIEFAAERKSSEAIIGKQSDALESVTTWDLSGSAGMKGEAGLKLEAAMWGGVPLIAAIRAGVRAAMQAGVESKVELGGNLETVMSSAAEGQKPTLISRTGQVFFQATGEGLLEAALSLFAGFELFLYKGDLYELVLARCPLASLAVGARFGANLATGAKPDYFKEPTAANSKGAPRYLAYDFGLIERLWKARKLDKAKAASTDAKANAGSLSDVRDLVMDRSTDVDESGDSVEKETLNQDKLDALVAALDAGEDAGIAPNAAMVKLMNEDTVLRDNLEGAVKTIMKMKDDFATVKEQDTKQRAARWVGKGWRGDTKELKAYYKELANLEGNVTKQEKRRLAIAAELAEARKSYAATLRGLDGPALLAKAKAAVDTRSKVYQEQWKFFQKEFDGDIEVNRIKAEGLKESVEEAQLKVLRKQDELAAANADYEARRDEVGSAEQDLRDMESRVDDLEQSAKDIDANADKLQIEAALAKKKRGVFSSKTKAEKDYASEREKAKKLREQAKQLRSTSVEPRIKTVAKLKSKDAINQRRNELHAAQALLITRQQQARQFEVERRIAAKGTMQIITGIGVGTTRREQAIDAKVAARAEERKQAAAEGRTLEPNAREKFQAAVKKTMDAKKMEGVDPKNLVSLKDAVALSGMSVEEFANLVGQPGSPFTVYPSGLGRRYDREQLEKFARKRRSVSVK